MNAAINERNRPLGHNRQSGLPHSE
jgi:hypothetical protein